MANNGTLVNAILARGGIGGLSGISVDGAVIDQGTASELIVSNDLDSRVGRGNGVVSRSASNSAGVKRVNTRLRVVGLSVIPEEKTELEYFTRASGSWTRPTSLDVTGFGTSIAVDLVTVVASLLAVLASVTADSLTSLSRERANETPLENASLGTTITVYEVTIVASFGADLQTVSAQFIASIKDGGCGKGNGSAWRIFDGEPTNRASTDTSANRSSGKGIDARGGLTRFDVIASGDSAFTDVLTSSKGN